MLKIILDFLLVPALVTTGLLAPAAVALGALAAWLTARRSRGAVSPPRADEGQAPVSPAGLPRQALAFVLGLFATLFLIVVAAAATTRLQWPWLRPVGWALVAGAWALAFGLVARYRGHAAVAAAVLAALAWVLDTQVTERLLFE